MLLSNEQFQQLEEAFNDAFTTLRDLNALVIKTCGKNLDQLGLNGENAPQIVSSMLQKAHLERWLANLIDNALQILSTNGPLQNEAFQDVRDQLLPAISWNEKRDPFAIYYLREERVLLDRDELRKALSNIHSETGKRIFIVDGERFSGKTYSWELIHYVERAYKFFRTILIDLDRLAPSGIQAEDLGRAIASLMDLGPLPKELEQQPEHWVYHFGNWLVGQLANVSTKHWIVIDSFSGKLLPPHTQNLIYDLASWIDKKLANLRLILLSYQDRVTLNTIIPGRIEYEFIKTFKAENLLPFFLNIYEEREAKQHIPFTQSDVIESTRLVWRQVDHEDPYRMARLGQTAHEEAKRILAPPPPPSTRRQMLAEMEKQLYVLDLSFNPSSATAFTSPRYGPYYQAAAVLSFFRATALRSVPGIPSEESVQDVLKVSKPLLDEQQEDLWVLQSQVRRDVIKQMGNREALQRALAANLPLPDNSLQKMLSAYITGNAPSLSSQDLSQTTATFQIVDWLENIIPDLPDKNAIRQQQELLGLLQPFRELAGDNFRGRQQELHILRAYIGILPAALPDPNDQPVTSNSDFQDQAPSIYGTGGVGKSTLLARLILDHALLPNEQRFLWSYVDFERPGVRIEEPLTILIEAVQQLGILYPDARKFCDKVRDTMREKVVKYEQRRSPHGPVAGDSHVSQIQKDWERYSRDFANLLKNLHLKQNTPFLLVLDTLERTQHHSPVVVASLCLFLNILKQSLPHLKTVFVGRAPLIGTSDYPTRVYPLKGFDAENAQGYLATEAHKLLTPDQAKKIVTRLGPHPLPLTLKLIVIALERVGKAEIEKLLSNNLLMFHLEESELQGQLFLRILNNINDPDVRKLAYPGFVLRCITPALIREVLADPCGITLKHPDDAQRLFETLRHDESLVLVENDTLRHRPELRAVMIRLIHRWDRDKARRIEEAAIAYYERQEGSLARAEELYHRLSLRQPISILSERWVDDTIVKNRLTDALDELSGPEKVWLATHLDFPLTPEDRSQADLESWERDTEQRVREFLQRGRAEGAIAILQEREERSLDSPLYELQAQAYELLENWLAAIAVLKKGLSSVSYYQLAVALRIHSARLATRLMNIQTARQYLDEAEKLLLNRDESSLFLLEIGLQHLGLDRVERKASEAHFKERLYNLFDGLSDEQVASQPVLMGWFAGELGRDRLAAITRIVRLTGLFTERMSAWRTLARALTAWEQDLVALEVWSPGELARMAGFSETAFSVEAWTARLQEDDTNTLARFITMILEQHPLPPLAVLNALIDILGERAWSSPNSIAIVQPGSNRLSTSEHQETAARSFSISPPGEPFSEYIPVGLGKLTRLQFSQFSDALLASFTRDELEQMIRFRLERDLDALSLSNNRRITVYRLIQQAQAEDWTAQLLAAALDARPANSRLRAFADQFGLAPKILSPDASREIGHSEQLFKTSSSNFADATQMLSHLGHLETQVCQVEIGHISYGTGFLIGPDMLMTSYHIIEPMVKGHIGPQQVLLRFDYKLLPDNKTVSTGTIYHLANDWLIDYSDYSSNEQLDFALLRISGAPGNEPIGGERAEPDAPPRGWITPPSFAPAIIIDTPLFILQHTEHGPLQLTYHQHGITGLNDSGSCLFHRVNTASGSGGAPCFNQNWELIAIHQGKSTMNDSTHINTAILITAILTLLRERNTFVPGRLPDMSVSLNQLRRNVHLRISIAIQSIQHTSVPFLRKGYISPRQRNVSAEALHTVSNNLLDLRQYLDDTLLNPATSLPDSIVQHYPASIHHINMIVDEVKAFTFLFTADDINRQMIQQKAEALISNLQNLEGFIYGMGKSS